MKLLAIIAVLAPAVTSIKQNTFEHTLAEQEHKLFWCCDRHHGEKCGLLWQSCCQPNQCTLSNVGVRYCPDQYQLDC